MISANVFQFANFLVHRLLRALDPNQPDPWQCLLRGSDPAVAALFGHVRFTPGRRHRVDALACPKRANKRHSHSQQIAALFDHLADERENVGTVVSAA